jgi:hypothetical protein
MSQTNSHGYILPINDLSMSLKYNSAIKSVRTATTAACTIAEPVADAFVVTAAQLLNGHLISGTGCAGAYTVTLPTAAVLLPALSPYTSIGIGTSIRAVVDEVGGQQMTWTGAAGITVVGTATLTAGRTTEAVLVCTAADGLTWKTFLVSN